MSCFGTNRAVPKSLDEFHHFCQPWNLQIFRITCLEGIKVNQTTELSDYLLSTLNLLTSTVSEKILKMHKNTGSIYLLKVVELQRNLKEDFV